MELPRPSRRPLDSAFDLRSRIADAALETVRNARLAVASAYDGILAVPAAFARSASSARELAWNGAADLLESALAAPATFAGALSAGGEGMRLAAAALWDQGAVWACGLGEALTPSRLRRGAALVAVGVAVLVASAVLPGSIHASQAQGSGDKQGDGGD
jgi:hypothetical protein